jgi:hypothetical protein
MSLKVTNEELDPKLYSVSNRKLKYTCSEVILFTSLLCIM